MTALHKINPEVALRVRRDLVAHLAKLDAEYAALPPTKKVLADIKSKILRVAHRFSRNSNQ